MKSKILIVLASVVCALACVFGLAACDFGGNSGGGGDNSDVAGYSYTFSAVDVKFEDENMKELAEIVKEQTVKQMQGNTISFFKDGTCTLTDGADVTYGTYTQNGKKGSVTFNGTASNMVITENSISLSDTQQGITVTTVFTKGAGGNKPNQPDKPNKPSKPDDENKSCNHIGNLWHYTDIKASTCIEAGWSLDLYICKGSVNEGKGDKLCGKVFISEAAAEGNDWIGIVNEDEFAELEQNSDILSNYKKPLPLGGHTIVIDEAVKATCSEKGLTEGSHCGVCNDVIKAQEETPFGEHSYTDELAMPGYAVELYNVCGGCGHLENTALYFKAKLNKDGNYYTLEKASGWTAINFTDIKTYNRKSITHIGESAFYGDTLLKSVTIGGTVAHIGASAFENCASLDYVNLCDMDDNNMSVIEIGDTAFLGCSKITHITIPESVTKIGWSAFEKTGITSITIPESVTEMYGAFVNCSNLETVYWNAVDCKSALRLGGGGYETAFDGTNLKTVIFGNKVTKINDGSFFKCDKLTSVTISDSVTSIGFEAFSGCPIKTATIPASAIGYIYNDNLKTVTITSGEKNIENGAFAHYDSLESINVDSGNTRYHSVNNCIIEIATKTLISGCKSSVIPKDGSVTRIAGEAFLYCRNLTSITIPDCITSIDDYAFKDCNALTIYCEAEEQPSGWSNYWNSYRPVVWDCKNNNKDENGYEYAVIDGISYSLKDGIAMVIMQPTNITVANIPTKITYKNNEYSVTGIEDKAFYYCDNLTSINIPDSVTSVGESAFKGCRSLTNIIIPDSVKSIDSYAFVDCSNLTSVTIGNGVTSIDSFAFSYCSSLTSITFNGTKAQWKAIGKGSGWDNNTGNYTIHCTDGDIAKN